MKAILSKIFLLRASLATVIFAGVSSAFAQVTIDFTDASGYGLDEGRVMLQNLRVDQAVDNPFDPDRPDIVSSFYNIPWRFNYNNLHLEPDLDLTIEVNEESQCSDLQVYVTDAFNGTALENAQVEIAGNYATTDSAGVASFSHLVSGTAFIEATALDYYEAERQIELSCDTGVSVGIALNPLSGEGALGANEVRIILTWGEHPRDLDSHLTGPDSNSDGTSADTTNRFHIYFSAKTADVAVLDVDDISSYGPETITITPVDGSVILRPGLYRYSVYHYSGEQTISSSNASIHLQFGSVNRFFGPPAGAVSSGDVWTVFELLVSSTGLITVYEVNNIDTDFQGGSSQLELRIPGRTPPYGESESGIDFSSLPEK